MAPAGSHWTDRKGYSLHLLDESGAVQELHADPEMSCCSANTPPTLSNAMLSEASTPTQFSTSRPAASASRVDGTTPMPTMTRSAPIARPTCSATACAASDSPPASDADGCLGCHASHMSPQRGLLLVGGIVQLLFGLWMIAQPVLGGLTIVAVIAAYAMVLGVILIIRGLDQRVGGSSGPVAFA